MKTLVLALAAIMVPGLAASNPHEYVLGLGSFVLCDPAGLGFDVGGVCIPAGHIDAETVTLTIADDIMTAVSGFACQDTNADGICGGPGELGQVFCVSIVLTAGANWEASADLQLFLDDPVFGSPALSVCGLGSFATHGSVHHT